MPEVEDVQAGVTAPRLLDQIDRRLERCALLGIGVRPPADVREVVRSHLNYVVADTKVWEQSAAYILDTHPAVDAFVKNAGLGFAIPYLHNGQPHDYVPDFIVLLKARALPAEAGSHIIHVIVETKGFDELAEVKAAAAERWVAAVNADGQFGEWRYAMARRVADVRTILDKVRADGSQPEPRT